jgi:sulfatase maturation enzyme AslB (radical SAM superfamily)
VVRFRKRERVVSRFTGVADLPDDHAIIWSGLTGFVAVIPSEYAYCLAAGDVSRLPEPALTQLDQNGCFCSKDCDEDRTLVELLRAFAGPARRPTSYRFMLTGACNLACNYCWQKAVRRQLRSKPTPTATAAFATYVEAHAPPGDVNITLFGGEPLYDVGIACTTISGLCERFEAEGNIKPRFRILTNGLNLPEFLEEARAFRSCIRDIQVTLDQTKSLHDALKCDVGGKPTYDRIAAAVRDATSANWHITVRMNIHDCTRRIDLFQACERLYDESRLANLRVYPALVLKSASTGHSLSLRPFGRLVAEFFEWHYQKFGRLHPWLMPPPKWVNCASWLGPPTVFGPSGEMYKFIRKLP